MILADGAVRPERILGELLASCVDGGQSRGGQVAVASAEGVWQAAVGCGHDGRPIEDTHLAEVFCLTKPFAAAACLRVLEADGVDPAAPVGAVDPALRRLGAVSVADIVNHDTVLRGRAELGGPGHGSDRLVDIRDVVLGGGPVGYSGVAGWLVLDALVRAVTGCDLATVTRHAVLTPLGLDHGIVVAPADAAVAGLERRIWPAWVGLPSKPMPLLHVLQPGYLLGTSPVRGGFASARGLAVGARALGDSLAGRRRQGLPSPPFVAAVSGRLRPVGPDATWRRPAGFCLGLEHGATHRCGHVPARLWLSAGEANATMVVEPDRGRGAALVLDGAAPDRAERASCRRRLFRALDRIP